MKKFSEASCQTEFTEELGSGSVPYPVMNEVASELRILPILGTYSHHRAGTLEVIGEGLETPDVVQV